MISKPDIVKRNKQIDKVFASIVKLLAILSCSFVLIILVFISIKGIAPFLPSYENGIQDIFSFITGNTYRQDQAIYQVGFIIVNTIISGALALLIAFPIAVLTALFITRIAPKPLGSIIKSVIELLASIPSVVYGVFASGVITYLVASIASTFNITTYGGSSLLSVILLLAIMIFPTITSMSITAIEAVDKSLLEASLALGATKTQTNFKIVLIAAKSGIFSGAILGLGRAFGEATAVAMVAGNKLFGPTFNLFDITRTLTSTMLVGLKETTGLDYDIRFSVGLVLICVIFISNLSLNYMKNRIGRMYES